MILQNLAKLFGIDAAGRKSKGGSSGQGAENDQTLSIKRATALRDQGNIWSSFSILKESFIKNPTDDVEILLSEMIRTDSPISDVFSAMDSGFDRSYYLSSNPDVRKATAEADVHYLLYGWREGRSPSIFFDHAVYSKLFPDLPKNIFPLTHYQQEGRNAGRPASGISDRLWFDPVAPSDEEWEGVEPAPCDQSTRAAVVLPVYKGYDETLAAIYHALKSREGEPYGLLVVNDTSPDPELTAKMDELAGKGLFDYHVNSSNLGFVRSVNLALERLTDDKDVILLNSDAYVFPGWFGRLIAHADRDPLAATITPLSNNATILSYPITNQDNHLALELSPQELDEIAASVNAGLVTETPTGVGFCMYMRRSVIKEIGVLDDRAFKVGYGEENDFCMRAIGAGYRNLVATDVFVFHKGSVSFASIKDDNFSQGQTALALKHPNYTRLVTNHVAADPEQAARRNLDAERLVRRLQGCVVFVTHKQAGGIDTYLEQEQKQLEADGVDCIYLRVHDGQFVSFEPGLAKEPFIPNLKMIDISIDWEFVKNILCRINTRLYHVNSLVGLSWIYHEKFLTFIQESNVPYVYIGHDYSPISHHYQLLRPDNVLGGIPDLETRQKWLQMRDPSEKKDACDPRVRLERYAEFLGNASRVIIPSQAAADIYAREFPNLNYEVIPHKDHLPDVIWAERRPDRRKLSIAVVGAIGPHKGIDILAGLAAQAKNSQLPISYYLIGYSNANEDLVSLDVGLTGAYRSETEALAFLDEIQPDLFFIPSIWPETFCYTLSMALKKGIPPIVFDLGAQAERVKQIDWGVILPIELARSPERLSEELLALNVNKLWAKRHRVEPPSKPGTSAAPARSRSQKESISGAASARPASRKRTSRPRQPVSKG